MKISTRGRYALSVMIDLAGQPAGEYVPLKGIAAREGISLKYLESIAAELSRAGLLDALHGKGGGYRLNRPPEDYTVGSVLRSAEGSLAPVSCLEAGTPPCPRASECPTRPLWAELNAVIGEFFDRHTLAELLPGA